MFRFHESSTRLSREEGQRGHFWKLAESLCLRFVFYDRCVCLPLVPRCQGPCKDISELGKWVPDCAENAIGVTNKRAAGFVWVEGFLFLWCLGLCLPLSLVLCLHQISSAQDRHFKYIRSAQSCIMAFEAFAHLRCPTWKYQTVLPSLLPGRRQSNANFDWSIAHQASIQKGLFPTPTRPPKVPIWQITVQNFVPLSQTVPKFSDDRRQSNWSHG